MRYLLLGLAVVAEVAATTALARSEGFTRPGPVAVVVGGYGAAFYLLSRVLQTMPTGVAYGLWSGLGLVLVTLVAWLWGRQTLDAAALIGLSLIVVGIATIHFFSRSAAS